MLVIGSHALSKIVDINRAPKDLDVLITRDELSEYVSSNKEDIIDLEDKGHKFFCKSKLYGYIEFGLIDEVESSENYYEYCGRPKGLFYAPAEVLFSLKKSHIHFPRSFDKHILDYNLLRSLVKVDVLSVITRKRTKEIEAAIGKLKTPSLKKSTKDFFDDKVSNKTFIHDHIHAVIAHKERPMFEYIKPDADKVTCSKDLWSNLEYEDKIKCVLEEAYVIALERGVIPMLFAGGSIVRHDRAFKWAVMRICTTLCSGWFRTFAVDNYPEVIERYDPNYVDKFLKAYSEGKIEKVGGKEKKVLT